MYYTKLGGEPGKAVWMWEFIPTAAQFVTVAITMALAWKQTC